MNIEIIESSKTQREAVLKHLQTHKSLTSWEAFERYGCTRLSAIIFVLRKRGFNIESQQKLITTRYGKRVAVAEYVLKGVNDDARVDKTS